MKPSIRTAMVAAAVIFSGCRADPNSVDDQLKVLAKSHRTKEKVAAVEHLKKIYEKNPEAVKAKVDVLADQLKEPGEAKTHLAALLGQIKDPTTVPALIDAIDYAAQAGGDRADQESNRANKEICTALANIGDHRAVRPLVLLLKSKDNYVRLEAINGLARLKDPEAVEPLSKMATDEAVDTFVNKKAIIALGEIADPKAIPAIDEMLFREREGKSFYPESSFALFEIGDAARENVLKVLKGDDKVLLKWAKEHRVLDAALYAKAAQLVGDLQDKRAISRLVQLLDFLDPDEKEQFGKAGVNSVMVRVQAADALGRLRAKEGVKAIDGVLAKVSGSDIDDPNVRSAYARSLVMIGDRGAVPTLVACSKKGYWDAREGCMAALSRLGSEADAKNFDDFLKVEPALFAKECTVAELTKQECEANTRKHLEVIKAHKRRIDVMKGCGTESCLVGKLKNDDALVRERASWELGRMGSKAAIPALFAAIQRPALIEDDLSARFAALTAVDWIAGSSPDAMKLARPNADALDALLEKEKGSAMTVKIDEDVRRLVVNLRRKS